MKELEVDVVEPVQNRFDMHRLGSAVDFMRQEPMFQYIEGLDGVNADVVAAHTLNDLSDLRFVNCIEQCIHGCIHCSELAGPKPQYIPFDDFHYELQKLRSLKDISGLRFSYTMFDVTTHQDGDTMMYVGHLSKDKSSPPSYSSYDVLKAFRGSQLFDSGIPGRDRFQLFTTGWFDYGRLNLISNGARQVVENADEIFGHDPKTGEPGRMVFSFGTYPKYFSLGEQQRNWWTKKLIQMFSTIKPLFERGHLQFSVKYLLPDKTGQPEYDIYSGEYQLELLADLLQRAGYENTDSILSDDTLVRVRPAYRAGRSVNLDLPFTSAASYVENYYPKEYSEVRLGTQWENTLTVNGVLKRRPVKSGQYHMVDGTEQLSQPIAHLWLPSRGQTS